MSGYTTGTGNELTASPGTTYTYDNEGNLAAQTSTTTGAQSLYTWDYRNRLTGVAQVSAIVGVEREFGLYEDAGGYYLNYRGSNEKYLRGTVSSQGYSNGGGDFWYYITTSGDLYEFTPPYTNSSLVGALVAQLGTAAYTDPSLVTGAALAVTNDQAYGFYADAGGYYLNYRGQNEKYLRGTVSSQNYSNGGGDFWYYILPNGDLYEFTPPYANSTLTGVLVSGAHLGTAYYNDPSLLTGAVAASTTAVATYTYDAVDRRIGFKDNGVQTWVVWDGQNPYADFNGSGTLQQRYLYGPALDALLARTDSGGTTAWYLTDRLGSVRDIANTSGTVIDHVVYDSFGNQSSESSPSNGDRFKVDGMEWDTTIGKYFDNARWYDPASGRFVGQDPTYFGANDANVYRFTANSPTNATDTDGKRWVWVSQPTYQWQWQPQYVQTTTWPISGRPIYQIVNVPVLTITGYQPVQIWVPDPVYTGPQLPLSTAPTPIDRINRIRRFSPSLNTPIGPIQVRPGGTIRRPMLWFEYRR
jgi:RHS repeat-associated protein